MVCKWARVRQEPPLLPSSHLRSKAQPCVPAHSRSPRSILRQWLKLSSPACTLTLEVSSTLTRRCLLSAPSLLPVGGMTCCAFNPALSLCAREGTLQREQILNRIHGELVKLAVS